MLIGCLRTVGVRGRLWESVARGSVCLTLAAGLHPASFSFLQTNPKPLPAGSRAAVTKPSLDALVQRVDAYWNLLVRGKKIEAMEFVEKSCRAKYIRGTVPPFSRPRITKLELTSAGREVSVTVNVFRVLPPLPGEFDWPVQNQWVFSGGTWYVQVRNDVLTQYASASQAKSTIPSPEEAEKRRAAIRDKLRFVHTGIDFGTVRQGRQARFALEYDLDGDQFLNAFILDSPIAADLIGMTDHKLHPGKAQKADLCLLTDSYDGAIDEPLSLLVRSMGVEVLYEFRLSGRVYTPLSALPRVVRFLEGEQERKFEVRNNSATEVRIESVYSESNYFEVSPLPQILAPGARCELTVKSHVKDSEVNRVETILLRLAQPVDEMYNLPLVLITHFQEQKREKRGPLSQKQIQDLIQKHAPSPIKP